MQKNVMYVNYNSRLLINKDSKKKEFLINKDSKKKIPIINHIRNQITAIGYIKIDSETRQSG